MKIGDMIKPVNGNSHDGKIVKIHVNKDGLLYEVKWYFHGDFLLNCKYHEKDIMKHYDVMPNNILPEELFTI